MIRQRNVRNITKFKRSIKAISPVIATLLMIAIAVVASLVVYAWVSGYIGFQTGKAGQAIALPSFAGVANPGTPDEGALVVYVQNVGQGTVEISAVYVDDQLRTDWQPDPSATIDEGNTIKVTITGPFDLTVKRDIKVTTTSGTSMTLTNAKPGTGQAPNGNPDYTTTTVLALITTPLTSGQTNVPFSGSVSSSGTAVPNGVPVVLQYSTSASGPWTDVATANTDDGSGGFSGTFTAPAAGTYYFQAYFASYTSGANTWTTSTSSQQTIKVGTRQTIFTDGFSGNTWPSQWTTITSAGRNYNMDSQHTTTGYLGGFNDGILVLRISTTGYTSIQLNYDSIRGNAVDDQDTWTVAWGTDGTTFANVITTAKPSGWTSNSFTLSSGADNQNWIYIRFYLDRNQNDEYFNLDSLSITGIQ